MEAASHPVAGATPRARPLGVRRPRRGEEAIRIGLFAAAAISVLTTIGILYALLSETIKFFGDVGITKFVTDGEWTPTFADPEYGVWPLINGTLLITAIAIAVAVPLGIGSAIYLAEYATPRVRKIVKPILEVLVGVPTVVFGFFALSYVTPVVLQDTFSFGASTQNALAAGVVVGVMILPTIASISEDAMAAVPQGLREGAYGLGASRMQVALRVVVPAALSGIVAAIVLGVSRGIGETMIVLIAAGLQPNEGFNLLEGFETMTTFIAATGQGDIPTGSTEYKTIFAVGTILFFMTLAMNMIAIRFVRRYRQVYD